MAKSVKKKLDEYFEEKIIPINLEEIVGERFGRYSKYIIQDRALPDVRDGLKPVQRRILFAMNELGMGSTKAYKKSARIVGEVIGKYHPHGDTSVYDAMVRMSQTWKLGTLLIDMHGNNGSIDNDPAAAMRYTEARLTVFSEALLKDIDKKTVTFVPNFDDCELEPVVLPAKFPNLLVNGGTGMATGYATNIPPHNLSEVLSAVIYKIKNPQADIDDLLKIMPGPDFPTGALVEGTNEIKKAFLTGKGKVVIKAKAEVEDTSIVITEIPYEVNKADLVRKIDEIRLQKKIDGIVEVNDLSDRDGIRIVIKLKKEIASEVILAYLYKNTDLSVTFNYNMVAISQRSPKLLSLEEILVQYIQHQKEMIRNRSNYELTQTEKRKHIVSGFLKMVSVLDEVIALIRSSMGKKDAINKLIEKYEFTETQADAIVSLQLYRLSTTDVTQMKKESQELTETIKRLEKILNNEIELENAVVEELEEILNNYPVKRKTVISGQIQKVEIDEQELIENENVMFVMSKDGYIKRCSLKSYQATTSETGLKDGDMILKQTEVNTRDNLLFFTNFGNFITLPVYKIPDLKYRDLGDYIGNYAHLIDKEVVIDYLVVDEFDDERDILLANQDGQVKRVLLSEFQKTRINRTFNCLPANRLNQLVSVDLREKFDRDIVLVTRNGYVLKYDLEEVSCQSLNAKGVKGINLRDDVLIGAKFTTHINKDEVLMLTNRGGLKREFVQNIDYSHRPAKGKRYLKTVQSNPYQFVAMSAENIFRLKDVLTIRILNKKQVFTIPGTEIKPDRYENGIPYLSKSDKPENLMIEINNYHDNKEILINLIDIVEEEVIEETDEMMNELEKIISSSKEEVEEDLDNEEPIKEVEFEEDEFDDDEDDDEDDLDDNIVQQTLF
ncbi:MAG: DNA topoisomerase IV subunit A [Candidatus Izemoplasmatales bacterium]|nr:DNA topoisomerase IV subunit A [Candidatus Izemoplasmatales bacterium]